MNARSFFCSGLMFMGLFMLVPLVPHAQGELTELLREKATLDEVMAVVNPYLRSHPEMESNEEDFESEELHWRRWEWYMSGRLGPHGEFVNVPELLMDGLKEKEKMIVPRERNINSGWTFMGPSTSPLQNPNALFNGIGRVDRIVFHPTNANIIFLCTPAGGLWNTLNGGTTWNNLTDHLPSVGISGFVISYANTSIMYLLTGDGDAGNSGAPLGYARPSIGVLKSIDGGVSWHQTGTLPSTGSRYVGYRLVQNTTNPEVLLAATSAGLYQTTDGGITWTQRLTGYFFDAEFTPGNGSIAYASGVGVFFKSTDGGTNWANNANFDFAPIDCTNPSFGGRTSIAIAPSSPGKVYLLSGPTGSGVFCGFWLSTDNGNNFTRMSYTPNILGNDDAGYDNTDQSYYDLALAVRSDLSTQVFTGGLTVWQSIDGGDNWTHTTSYNENGAYNYIHPDIHDIVYNPINNWLYVASDGGVFRSTNHGVSWTDLSPNIETSMFYHMRGWDGNANKLMGGLQDNGVKYRTSNSSAFYHISGADGFDVVFNPDTGQPGYSTINEAVIRYSSDGASEATITPSEDSLFFKTVVVHNTNPDTILVGTSDIFRSYNAGSNYSNRGASGSWSLTACPSNNSKFYATGGVGYYNGAGALYLSTDIGGTWVAKSTNPGFPAASNYVKITDVTVLPTNSAMVYASFGGFNAGYKVVMSVNNGDSWTNISANLPNVPINALAVDNDNGVYAGTDIGVFYRSATMSNWMPWSNALPNCPVTDLFIYDNGSIRRLRASTYGRGVWQSNLAETCDPAIVVTGGLEGIRHYEASTSVTSSAFIQGGIGTFVSYKSGSYITLSEGFNVVDESEFLGFISPCGQGGIPSVNGEIEINRSDPNSSIILLRRMWDPETEMPYGSIHDITYTDAKTHVTYDIRKQGHVSLIAAKAHQEKLIPLFEGDLDAGYHSIDINLSGTTTQGYYLLLFYEGKLVHFQELIREQ